MQRSSLNPFEIRAGQKPPTKWQGSGQGRLNPFEIRAGQKLGTINESFNISLNPFEIRAGQKHAKYTAKRRAASVLIPLKSGQARNALCMPRRWRSSSLNPFEIRAGQKHVNATLSTLYGLNPFEIRAGQKRAGICN